MAEFDNAQIKGNFSVAPTVTTRHANRWHRHYQPARQPRCKRWFQTGAGHRVHPQGGDKDRPGGDRRVEEVGQRPLGIPGDDLLDRVDDDQTR